MEKVTEWRKLHEEGDKLNLDKAAEIIGISRKTLDDYNLQMRRAEEMGFDLQEHKNSKMGQLRKFVKSHSPKCQSQRKNSNSTELLEEPQSSSNGEKIVDVDEFLLDELI